MSMQPIEEPFDEYEKQLLSRIDEIKQRAQIEMGPFVKLLAESRGYKPVKYIVATD